MKKLFVLLTFLILLFIILTNLHKPNVYEVSLNNKGFEPNELTIKKGDSVLFKTTLDAQFWPASDPHPSHNNYSEFDPKRALLDSEAWKITFDKSGIVNFHNHLMPNQRGTIIIKDENPITKAIDALRLSYKNKFEKHDLKFLANNNTKCGKPDWTQRIVFDNCWDGFFSDITRDFGPPEAMRLVKEANLNGILSNSDCHNRADNVGIDSYWKYVAGNKFNFTKDFFVCQEGFFHGFMMEHVSHTQSLAESVEICQGLDNSDSVAIDQCYVGIGGGLAFLYWGEYGDDSKIIIEKSLSECAKFESGKDHCVYGVYGGLEHLYTGFHGSDMRIDSDNPFEECTKQKNLLYKNFCIERLRGPAFSVLNYEISKIMTAVESLGVKDAKFVAQELGRYLVLHQIYNSETEIVSSLLKCRQFQKPFVESCFNGGFNEIFTNSNEFNGRYKSFNCDIKMFDSNESYWCKHNLLNT